jgi:hypothetical protein
VITTKQAQEIARGWHGGKDVNMTALSHGRLDKLDMAGLIDEISRLIDWTDSAEGAKELRTLLAWARGQ